MSGKARVLSVFLLGSAVAAAMAQQSIDAPRQPLDRSVLTSFPNRDFRRDPPKVRSASVRPVQGAAAGTVLLRVTFAERNLPKTIVLEVEQGRVVLRDDGARPDNQAGDGVFHATATLPDATQSRQRELSRSLLAQRSTRIELPVARRGRVFRRVTLDRELVQHGFIPLVPPFGRPGPPPGPAPAISKPRSLMITASGVVDDKTRTANPCQPGTAGGPWSFGFLMTEMANTPLTGITASDFTRKWLAQWQANQIINSFNVPPRFDIQADVITPWQNASGGPILKMDKAPFRLLAIVNRLDLRDNVGYGAGAGGELRFVYGLMKNCKPTQFTVIFEFGVPPKSCLNLKAYAKQWADLSGMTPGTAAYNTALQAITDPIVKRNAMPSKPNGSALNQLRTNEIELARPWELREFRIDATKNLRETTVKQTPHLPFNNTAKFTDFVNANLPAIHAGTYSVPLLFPPAAPKPFLAANAPVPTATFFWRGNPQIADNDARQLVSLGTCNGCHAGETKTKFTHIEPMVPIGTPATLSGFLTGINVPDPLLGAPTRTFNDLEERKLDMEALLGSPCLFHALFFEPLRMTH